MFHETFAVYGVRKMWQALIAEGLSVGRDQVARLMRLAGLQGSVRRRRVRTTYRDPAAARSPDLVKRDWSWDAPDRIWVAHFTHVAAREGTV